MSEGNKFVIRRSFEELWNKRNLSVADELFNPYYAHHDPSLNEGEGCFEMRQAPG
jgi:hypothetical protein